MGSEFGQDQSRAWGLTARRLLMKTQTSSSPEKLKVPLPWYAKAVWTSEQKWKLWPLPSLPKPSPSIGKYEELSNEYSPDEPEGVSEIVFPLMT